MYDYKSKHFSKEFREQVIRSAQRMRPQFLREVFHIPVDELHLASTRDNLQAVYHGIDVLVGYRTLDDEQIYQAFCAEISSDAFGFNSMSDIKCREAARRVEFKTLEDPEWFLENLWYAFVSAASADHHYAYEKSYE